MKIVAFGDSFQQSVDDLSNYSFACYQGLLLKHYKADETDVKFYGDPGSGPWHAFIKCRNYLKEAEFLPDVVLFGWSEACRSLYHPNAICLNPGFAEARIAENDINSEMYQAAIDYGLYISDHKKENYELRSLMIYFDKFVLNYPKIKFINLHNFSYLKRFEWWNHYDKLGPKQLDYHHRFINCAEVRPALMWMSRRDGWPGEYKMHLETRTCHLTEAMHMVVAEAIINCIDKYKPGLLVEIESYKMDKPYLTKLVTK